MKSNITADIFLDAPVRKKSEEKITNLQKKIFGAALFVLLAVSFFLFVGKSDREPVSFNAAIGNIVDNSISDIPEVGLISFSTYTENTAEDIPAPVICDLNLIKYSSNPSRQDQQLRDKIINQINKNIETSGLNVYPIVIIKFISSYK